MGITLLSCLGKCFTAVLNNRLQRFSDGVERIKYNQSAFRKHHSTSDHMFVLPMLIALFLHQRKKLFCAFVDYGKDFNKVWRSGLWHKMLKCSISGKIFDVTVKGIKSTVLVNGQMKDFFICNAGVRQGENLSPFLFALYIDDLEYYMQQHGIEKINLEHPGVRLVILYADNTVIISE